MSTFSAAAVHMSLQALVLFYSKEPLVRSYMSFLVLKLVAQKLTEVFFPSDVIKCRKERSSGVHQCPVCASPKNHNGKSLVDLPSASFTCTKPVIHDSLKSRNLTVPDDGDFSFVSPKDLIAPIGSVVLNMTDQAGNRGNLVCNVQKPKEVSPDRKRHV